jgi:hypothetical protein
MVYSKSKLGLDWDNVCNDKHRFFSATTIEKFNKMRKGQENNVMKIRGNLKEPSFKQPLLSKSVQDALFTIAYLKLRIDTQDSKTLYIFSFFAGNQKCATPPCQWMQLTHQSLLEGVFNHTIYQILSPMAYNLAVAILRLDKFNQMMYIKLHNWNAEFMWAFRMPLQVEKLVEMDENAVIFARALQLAEVEPLQYLRDNLCLKVITKHGISTKDCLTLVGNPS